MVTRVCVSVCLSVRGRMPRLLHGPADVTWGSGRGCPLVMHYCRICSTAMRPNNICIGLRAVCRVCSTCIIAYMYVLLYCTSMHSLTFCVRFLLPERHQRKPAVQTAAVLLRTPPSPTSQRPAARADPAQPAVRTMSSYRGMDTSV